MPDVIDRDSDRLRAEALQKLEAAFANPRRTFSIHYALQRLRRDASDTLPPVAAVALRNLATGEQTMFSMSSAAEAAGIDLRAAPGADRMLHLEYALLFGFNDFLARHADCRFVHWYMRDARFGFEALGARYRFVAAQVMDGLYGGRNTASAALFGYGRSLLDVAIEIERPRRVDLASILRRIFGIYPVQLRELAEANGLSLAELIDGKDEPAAFAHGKHARLAWSSATKARLIAELAELAQRGTLTAPQPRIQKFSERPLKVFISYRRKDTEAEANWLHEILSEQLGDDNVFIDTDDIPVGSVFEDVLIDRVRKCDVFLALIGREWANARDERGALRLMGMRDYVRLEIREALARSIPVIPVLMEGVPMPGEMQLPADLSPLLGRQGAVLRVREFRQDTAQLLARVRAATAGAARTSQQAS